MQGRREPNVGIFRNHILGQRRPAHGPRGVGRLREETGTFLVEAIVALFVVTLIFIMLTSAAMSALTASVNARSFQQATGLGREAIEQARNVPFESLAMEEPDDPPCETDDENPGAHPDPEDPTVCEPIVSDTGGLAYETTQTVGAKEFTVQRYVTQADNDLKRVITVVEWDAAGQTFSYATSTLIAPEFVAAPTPTPEP